MHLRTREFFYLYICQFVKRPARAKAITAPRGAVKYFTNRRGSIRRFAEYLNDSPHNRILYFHGDGGNGKTLLLRYLRQHCCKRLSADGWEYVRSMEGDAFIDNIVHAVDYTHVPSSMIDFGAEPRGEYRPKEAFSALLKMRRDLSGSLLPFPRFDFGCVLYLQKTGRLSKENPAQERIRILRDVLKTMIAD